MILSNTKEVFNFAAFQANFENLSLELKNPPSDTSSFVSYNIVENFNVSHFKSLANDTITSQKIYLPSYSIEHISNLLSYEQTKYLLEIYKNTTKQQLSTYAVQAKYGFEPNGIKRSSFYNYDLALTLFAKIFPYIDLIKQINGISYRACQLNPLMRFIEYQDSNCLIPHYDTTIHINENILTCSTVVIYLTTNILGQTRFLKESALEYSHNITSEEVLYQVQPKNGHACIFDHNILHDSNQFKKIIPQEENKIILTTEIVYCKNLDV